MLRHASVSLVLSAQLLGWLTNHDVRLWLQASTSSIVAAGLSTREIAQRVFVSENTVKTHSSRVFEKIGARRADPSG